MTQKPSTSPFSLTAGQQKLIDAVLDLLQSDLAKANESLKETLNEREYQWWSSLESLSVARENAEHFEACIGAWRVAVTAAITSRFEALLNLGPPSGPVLVEWAKGLVNSVLEKKGRPREAISGLMLSFGKEAAFPPGVLPSMRYDLDEALNRLFQPVETQLNEISQRALVDAAIREDRERTPSPLQNQFVKEGQTWSIVFNGEICRLPVGLDGLAYISVLLANPLKKIRAAELYSSISASPVVSTPFADAVTASISEYQTETEDGDRASVSQVCFDTADTLDFRARREYQRRSDELEKECTWSLEAGDKKKAADLRQEYDSIESNSTA